MKTLKCDLCEHTETAETFEAWMNALKPHYAEAHADVMQQKGGLTKEDQMKEMQQWMEENRTRFDAQADNA